MKTKQPSIHLEIQTSRKNVVGILRTSFYKDGKVKHTQHGRITGCSLNQLKLIQKAFQGTVIPANDPSAFTILHSREYGASFAILQIIQQTGLDKIIYSRKESWVNSVLAMIAGRIIYAGSKLSLSHMSEETCLWELCGIDKVDVDKHCYLPMDKLLARQAAIQKQLAQKHLSDGQIILYDITSSYLEGEYQNSEIVDYGYNRDGKKSHEQIVIGLICNKEGCPVAVEVFKGNTKDATTVIDKIKEIKTTYGVTNATFVGDRGMITQHNLDTIKQEEFTLISALSRGAINQLIEQQIIQPDLFDETNIVEIVNPETKVRYCLCRNPKQGTKNANTRNAILEKTQAKLTQIANYKKATTAAILGSRIGKALQQYNMAKYIEWSIDVDNSNYTDKSKGNNEKAETSRNHKVIWKLNQQLLDSEARLDGCYVITSDVPQETMTTAEVVENYKKLIFVENAFKNMKTVTLEMRPIYHKKDERIKAHVFLCMLAYYIQWHIKKAIIPLTVNTCGKNRRFTFTNVIQTLKQITKNKVTAAGTEFFRISTPTESQQEILALLGINL